MSEKRVLTASERRAFDDALRKSVTIVEGPHDIGWAVARLKEGKRVRRPTWHSAAFFHVEGTEWMMGPDDLLATDWEEAQ